MADLKPLPGSWHSLASQLLFIMHSRLLLAVALPPRSATASPAISPACEDLQECVAHGVFSWGCGASPSHSWEHGTWWVSFLCSPSAHAGPLLRASAVPLLSAVATLAFPLLTDPASCKLPGDRSHKHELCNPGLSRRLKPSMPALPSLPAVLTLDVALPNGHVFPCYGMPPGPAALWEHREVISFFLSQTSAFPLGCASCDAGCRRERGHLSLAPPGTCLI